MLISGGVLVDPSQDLERALDLRIEDDRIAEIGEHLRATADDYVLDARGAYVAPGFIDMHVHLREPGNPEKETIRTGTAAAVAGGFTAVCAMPNTTPPLDSPQRVADAAVNEPRDVRACCRVYPIACITRGRAGEQCAPYAELARAGAVAFSDDGSTVMNARVLYEAARRTGDFAQPLILHCEDVNLKADQVRNSQSNVLAEAAIVARDLEIALMTKRALHIAHVSTAAALDVVRAARARGARASCEVTPHHLVFTDAEIDRLGSGAKVNPPLRTAEDVQAVRRGVLDGTVDVFASDHAPHTIEEKSGDLACGAVGFTGLEVAVGAYAYAVPSLPVRRYVEMLSCNPARILSIAGGTLKIGSPADVTVFADRQWLVDPSRFRSKGKSTPFAGMTLPRRAIATIVAGALKHHDAQSSALSR